MLVLEGLLGLHRTIQLQAWITVMLNGSPWKQTEITAIFEIAPKYCILDSSVDYEGYSISCKGFLPQCRYNGHLN